MSKEEKIKSFDPNAAVDGGGIYGLPFTTEEATVVILPVPWEVTVSYHEGTAKAPQAILDASYQVDLYDPRVKDAWKIGLAMQSIPEKISQQSTALRKSEDMDAINKGCAEMVAWVKEESKKIVANDQLSVLLGGDHSTPLGLIQALAEQQEFGILQIDAHADLRKAYEGFEYSHASIMYNALKEKAVSKLVQVGIRDYCEEEVEYIEQSKGRVKTFFDHELKTSLYQGKTWDTLCDEIIGELPDLIYLSFDIDGLDPKLCPNTGTPVPGGFEYDEVIHLVWKIVQSGKRIIAFDLNEVAPGNNDWDANVGARLLYHLSNLLAASNGKS